MDIKQLQRRIGAGDDGVFGRASKAALFGGFTNFQANALTDRDLKEAATRLGCSLAQIRAVRQVEAAGKGYDKAGMPKILYERHLFHRLTGGKFSPAPFSQSKAGGYTNDANGDGIVDSWDRLCEAIATGEVDAAFQSCSWGLFQVLGQWWDELGYPSPFAMAWTSAQSEGDQLEMFVRYVEHFGLTDELRQLSPNPVTCRAFAAAYNGPGYRQYVYDEKLAAAMR
ncbi:N-acetylmuramidase domain-containing protein [Novosphingobium fluoreni]|uniref:N-acetylmuramidase domain-containing protein n=1 Tax=Novosphingobium fluoreni TaxID=1391222 RepID=UPI003DA06006